MGKPLDEERKDKRRTAICDKMAAKDPHNLRGQGEQRGGIPREVVLPNGGWRICRRRRPSRKLVRGVAHQMAWAWDALTLSVLSQEGATQGSGEDKTVFLKVRHARQSP